MANHQKHFSPTVLTYAGILLELANERHKVDAVQQELGQVRQVFVDSPNLRPFLSDPAIGASVRAGVVERAFKPAVSSLIWNFLRVLDQRGALGQLIEIADALDVLIDKQKGRVEVDITVAHQLDDSQLAAVRDRISRALKKDAVIHQFVDDSIIGGLVLKIDDQLIDASVRYQLQAMRHQLMEARHK